MALPEQALIAFFERVARKDPPLLHQLAQDRQFRVEEGRWRFTVPDLYVFLQAHDAAFVAVDYKRFRRALFNSPINATIKPHGAEIAIAENRGKVDQSEYALVWTR